MRRKHWIIALAILSLPLMGDVIYWRIVAERVRSGFQEWSARQAAQGWQVGSGPLAMGGWPRAARVTVPNLTLRHAGPTVPGEIDVAFAAVTLSVSLFDPVNLDMSLNGPLHVEAGHPGVPAAAGRTAGDTPDVIITGDETRVSVPLKPENPLPVAVHARDLRIEPASGAWHTTVGLLTAQMEIADGADPTKPVARFSVSSEAIALPAGIRWPLGFNISSLTVDGALIGPLPPSSDVTRWARAWRDGGGSLEIKHMAMGWGPLGLTCSAKLGLDDQLQPMGSGNGRIVGYAETLDRLAAAGMLTKPAATAAKAVLSLMAATSDADEPSSVDVPLTLQYRTLSMRQVPLLRLPELDWPAR